MFIDSSSSIWIVPEELNVDASVNTTEVAPIVKAVANVVSAAPVEET